MLAARVPWVLAFVLWAVLAPMAAAQDLTREEALASAYPGADIRAEQVFLTKAQVDDVAKRARGDTPPALIARYLARRGGTVVGRAYVDTHTVRTKKESLLISLDAAGRVIRVDVTAFLEPSEFRAPESWLRQYQGRELEDNLGINRAIRPIAGATLTARAANDAVRRVLAIDEILQKAGDRE
jgi:hypothetical protein